MEKNDKSFEWDWGKELERYDAEAADYWKLMDLEDERTDWEKQQDSSKKEFAEMLKGTLGKDMHDVMSGKVIVKLPMKLKIKNWFKRLFEIFS